MAASAIKDLIVILLEGAGVLSEVLFNFALSPLVSLVPWRGVLVCNTDLLVVTSLVFGYLQWREAVDPVRALVVGDSGEGVSDPIEKEPLISGKNK